MDRLKNAILISRNSNYAYKFRTKAESFGLQIQYTRTLAELLKYITEFNEGIVFVDISSKTIQSSICSFAESQCERNFSIVFLEDNNKVDIEIDNIFTYKSNFNDLANVLEEIKNRVHSRKNILNNIKDVDIDNYLKILTNKFGISRNLSGYFYIRDCIKVFLCSRDKKYNIIKEVYEIVANRYDKTIANIEKSIRGVISSALKRNLELFELTFINSKVTNSIFILYLVDEIKQMHCNR